MTTLATDLDALLSRSRLRRDLPPPSIRRLLRERAGLSQEAIANVLGVTRPTVTRWELGARTPRNAALVRYSELLDRLAAER
jgi:transcriptional regulator with XRE-family HTH domain